MMNGKEFYKYKSEAFKATNTTPPTEENPEPWLDNFTPTELSMYAAGQSTELDEVGNTDRYKTTA